MSLEFEGQTNFYKGKVRDVYTISDKWLVMIASNRISAFDVILPEPIPYKGQVLNQLAAFMLDKTKDICPNWLCSVPAPNVSIGLKCIPYKIELVVRGNLVGHSWRTYQSGKRHLCGAKLPEGMKENDFFPEPIITPSTKAAEGHDEDITPEEIVSREIATKEEWARLSEYALNLFERGKQIARERGLILADTKYEFGRIGEKIYLMDEIHTPDSSRYFFVEGFDKKLQNGERQEQLSKEFVREWLIANHFMGRAGEVVPEMTNEWVQEISSRYIKLYEKLTGLKFVAETVTEEEMRNAVAGALKRLQ